MGKYRITENRMQSGYRSYDYILEKHIGRPSKKTTARIRGAKRIGIFLTVLAVLLLAASFAVFAGKEPVEASDGTETVREYICVEVEEGDCLWSIAEEYRTGDSPSLEVFVAEVEEINGMDKDTVLQPGNKLMVPCYRTVSR